jgi:hypothetical protein
MIALYCIAAGLFGFAIGVCVTFCLHVYSDRCVHCPDPRSKECPIRNR